MLNYLNQSSASMSLEKSVNQAKDITETNLN